MVSMPSRASVGTMVAVTIIYMLLGVTLFQPPPAFGQRQGVADADVLFVVAAAADGNRWMFRVTVGHPDTGWDDYVDGWDVVLPDGTVATVDDDDRFTRLLLHPHEHEQPFTRSQSGIPIPADVTAVTVRAHDIVDGWGRKGNHHRPDQALRNGV